MPGVDADDRRREASSSGDRVPLSALFHRLSQGLAVRIRRRPRLGAPRCRRATAMDGRAGICRDPDPLPADARAEHRRGSRSASAPSCAERSARSAAVAGFILVPWTVGLAIGGVVLQHAEIAVLRNILGGLSAAAAGLLIGTGLRLLMPHRSRRHGIALCRLGFRWHGVHQVAAADRARSHWRRSASPSPASKAPEHDEQLFRIPRTWRRISLCCRRSALAGSRRFCRMFTTFAVGQRLDHRPGVREFLCRVAGAARTQHDPDDELHRAEGRRNSRGGRQCARQPSGRHA